MQEWVTDIRESVLESQSPIFIKAMGLAFVISNASIIITIPMQSKNKWKYLELILVTAILAFVYLSNLSQVEFHPDESQWIATSNIFESYVRLEFKSEAWDTYYLNLHQPPVACYTIGVGRFIGGYRRPDLNKPWDFERGREYNERIGAKPSAGLLWWSRLPMAILAILSITLGFLLLRKSSTIAAYAWLGLVVINPYFALHLRRAMGESTLVFFCMLTLYLATQALASVQQPSAHQKRNITMWLLLAGITSGLAGEAKLNGIVILGTNLVIAILLASLLNARLREKIKAVFWYGLVTSAACIFAFLAINPWLWSSPIARSVQMFSDRAQGMSLQTTLYSGSYMDPVQRITIIPTHVFQDYASLPIPAVFNFVLVSLGVLITLLSIRSLLIWQDFIPAYVTFLIMAFFAATPIWLSQLDWDRYYIFPVLFATVFTAIAIDWIINTSLRAGKKFFSQSSG